VTETAHHITPRRTPKTFAEFFAGIGLVRMGLEPGGWDCVYANDIEPKKHTMYESQFGPSPHYHVADIWCGEEVARHMPSHPFLATASFPCVDLSLAGYWRGIHGKQSSAYFGFLDILRRLRDAPPKLVMIENVYGFLTSGNGDDFHRAVDELAALGYWIDAIVLDARWFVPQSRPRTFVFGYHDSLQAPQILRRSTGLAFDNPWGAAVQQSAALRPKVLRALYDRIELPTGWATLPLNPPTQQTYSLANAIDLDEDQAWWTQPEVQKHYDSMQEPSRERVDEYVKQGATVAGTAFRRTRQGKTRCEVRFDIAGCLRTPKGGSAKQIVVAIIDGELKMRWMTAWEYARLQGADDFAITVPTNQAMFGFGDAVCVPAISWIDQHILTPLHDSHAQSEVATPAIA